MKALLGEVSIKALSRLYQGSIKALLRARVHFQQRSTACLCAHRGNPERGNRESTTVKLAVQLVVSYVKLVVSYVKLVVKLEVSYLALHELELHFFFS